MIVGNSSGDRRMCASLTDRPMTSSYDAQWVWCQCSDDELQEVVQKVQETYLNVLLALFHSNITYHLSRSALMLAQAAGTGASTGAAAVSESDMSMVVLGVEVVCPVLFLSSKRLWIPGLPAETERGTVEMRVSWWEGREHRKRWEEIKHVRGQHTWIRSGRGHEWRGTRVRGQWPRGGRLVKTVRRRDMTCYELLQVVPCLWCCLKANRKS